MPNLHKALEALTRLPQTPSQAVNELTASVRAVAADALKTLLEQQGEIERLTSELDDLRAELSGLRTYLTRSIAPIGSLDEAVDLLNGLSSEDAVMVVRWIEEIREPTYWSKDITKLTAELEQERERVRERVRELERKRAKRSEPYK